MSDIFKEIKEQEKNSFFKDEKIFRDDYTALSLDEVIAREERLVS